MSELDTSDSVPGAGDGMNAGGVLTQREKRDIQKAQLRPLANRRPELYDEGDLPDELEFEQMSELYQGTMASIEEGEIVKATVQGIRDNMVVLDIGFKSEGTVPLEEFKDLPELKAGDQVEVLLEHLEDQEGAVVLSKKKADFMRVWERIRVAYETDQPVEGTLVKKIKGGVVVDLMGVDAFLPGSQIALRRVPNIDELLGQKYEFKIIKLNKRRRNIVVSRRVILEAERAGKREKLMKELQKDQIRKGVVKNITDFGAFIDLGGVDGLLHITDMSWGRISHPSELVHIGQELEVKVLDIDWERERISLGLKQLQSYPWKDVAAKYPVGTRVHGKVVSITNYGAFIELEPGIEGLVHISEMSWTRNVRHPSKLVSIGEAIEAVVLKVDPNEEKISLGMKQTEQDPVGRAAAQVPGRHADHGQGAQPHELRRVRRDRARDRWADPHLRHVLDEARATPVGSREEGRHGRCDDPQHRLRQQAHQPRPQAGRGGSVARIGETYPVGTELRGKVVRLMDKGVVVDIGNDIEGFVPVSQLNNGKPVASPADIVYEGMNLDLRVLEVDPIHRRIVLAVTDIPAEQPPRPETPSQVLPMESEHDDVGMIE